MQILITGSEGFIGKRLKKQVGGIGIDLRLGLNLLTCPLPYADIVYHLAAQSDVMPSWDDPLHDLDNTRITARIAHNYPQAKIVYANSCAAMDPESPYGFSKKMSGEYLAKFHGNTVNCVFPNIFGPGSRSVVDKFKGVDEVTVYGDGLQTRDYVHVDDIVQGLVLAKDWDAGTYFMGSGKSTTVLELAEGKYVDFQPSRAEPHDVVVPNTTPNWNPTINVLDYIHD